FSTVSVSANQKYGTNIDFLKNSDFSNQAQVGADITDLKTRIATNQSIPAAYYNPADASTVVKVSDVFADIYTPTGDTVTDRPVILYIHTGNFLPPQINGSLAGNKTDSSAVEICTRLAKRGFVAVSMDYRLGWNPLASDPVTGPIIRRATLLNAVYRSLQDTKEMVRRLYFTAKNGNPLGIDTNKIVLYGEGSGGYVALAYATLDKEAETKIPKFVYPQTIGTTDSSYVQPSIVGDIEGYGGLLNLYFDQGISSEVSMVINAGGALADTSWLEAGDPAMVSLQCIRDPFAPFGEGTVVVPTTQEDVVDVQGANVFMAKANALGNNSGYQAFAYNDAYTTVARAKYGNTYPYIYPTQPNITVSSNIEGTFAIQRPKASSVFANEGSPWQWWAPGQSIPSPRTGAQAKVFIDTIMGYIVPRIIAQFELEGG
ncbi:MAG: alpha/beta hydrolase, partial [Owenweeksia sp.]